MFIHLLFILRVVINIFVSFLLTPVLLRLDFTAFLPSSSSFFFIYCSFTRFFFPLFLVTPLFLSLSLVVFSYLFHRSFSIPLHVPSFLYSWSLLYRCLYLSSSFSIPLHVSSLLLFLVTPLPLSSHYKSSSTSSPLI